VDALSQDVVVILGEWRRLLVLCEEDVGGRVVALDQDLATILRFGEFCKIRLESLEVVDALLFQRQSQRLCVSDPVAAIARRLL